MHAVIYVQDVKRWEFIVFVLWCDQGIFMDSYRRVHLANTNMFLWS